MQTWLPVPKYFSRNSVREQDINSTYSLDRNKDCIPYSILYYICNWWVSDSTTPLVTSINPHWFTSTMRFILQVHNNVTYRFQFVSYVKRVIYSSSVSPSGLTTRGRVVGGGRLTLFFSNTKDCSGLVTNSLKYTFHGISFEKRKWW